MFDKLLFFGIGLIIGWNVLPQPTWVKSVYDSVLAKIKSLLTPKSE